jgi:hypothetical protein
MPKICFQLKLPEHSTVKEIFPEALALPISLRKKLFEYLLTAAFLSSTGIYSKLSANRSFISQVKLKDYWHR